MSKIDYLIANEEEAGRIMPGDMSVEKRADAFISALTVELSKNQDIVQAMELATYAAGVSITRVGVQQSMIDQEGLERYKEHLSQ